MRRSIGQLVVGALALSAPLLIASSAFADRNASCGNIDFSAGVQCEVQVSGGCTANCTPINCGAQCDGQCTASASGSCTASCQGSCEANCMANPGSFDCEADCSGQCQGQCSSSSDQASCEGSCKGECHAKCTATPPSADCSARCTASCSGSCSFQANVDCDVSCSGSCTGGCQAQCMDPKGALFCNGQYVDASSIDDCVKWLEEQFNIKVTGYADASCSGNTCEADAGCSASSIANAPLDESASKSALAALAAGIGLMIARRRRKNA